MSDDTGRRRRYEMSDEERSGRPEHARSQSGEIECVPHPMYPEDEITPPPVSVSTDPALSVVWSHVNGMGRRVANLVATVQAELQERTPSPTATFSRDEVREIRKIMPAMRLGKALLAVIAASALGALGTGIVALKNAGERDGRVDAYLEELRHDVDRLNDRIDQLEQLVMFGRARGMMGQPPRETP